MSVDVQSRLDVLLSFTRWIARRECYCESGHGPFHKRDGDDPNCDLKCDPCRARNVLAVVAGNAQ